MTERAEPQLQDFEDLFENAPCGYLSADADGHITRVNATFTNWTGYTGERLIGRRFQDILNVAGRIYYETHFAPLLRLQGFFNEVALDVVRADRCTLPVLVNAVERRDDAGDVVFVRITIFNATDRRRYEGDLVEARRIAEAANTALGELNATLEARVEERTRERDRAWRLSQELLAVAAPDGTLAAVNPLWTALLGWDTSEIAGSTFSEYTHPDDLDATVAVFASIVERPLTIPHQYRFRHKDGSYRWFAWTASYEDGWIYATGRDVTAERTQAAALRQTETRASTYFNSSEDYLFLVRVSSDGSVYFEDMNPACGRVMGLVRADIAGSEVNACVPPESARDIIRNARLCQESRQTQTYLAAREYQNGQKLVIEGRVTFVEHLDDGAGLVFFSGRDVTEQRLIEDALRQSQKMEVVGQLTGGVAHDFNNLLTVIKSSTDLLKRPNISEERRARYVGAIADTVDRAAKLTGQLLAFARRQALQPEVFAIGEAVRGLADMIGTLTGSRIRVATDLLDAPCYVNADPSQFDTALVNLAVNARDAMNGEGRITIMVRSVAIMPAIRAHEAVEGAYVAVSISDTGSGIPEDQVERVFEPFFTTKEVGKGTGLGLSQVFGFAKQSGGDVTVASTLGQGTTFTLYLPQVPAPSALKAPERPQVLADGHGLRVLVVEDNVNVGSFAMQTLEDLGYVAVLAADGVAALAELAKDPRRFDLVFSDVVMPGMSGVDLGHEIRRLYHDVPVVLTSGYSHQLAQDGTSGFELLHKPYSIEQLSQMLRKVASSQRRAKR